MIDVNILDGNDHLMHLKTLNIVFRKCFFGSYNRDAIEHFVYFTMIVVGKGYHLILKMHVLHKGIAGQHPGSTGTIYDDAYSPLAFAVNDVVVYVFDDESASDKEEGGQHKMNDDYRQGRKKRSRPWLTDQYCPNE